MCIIYAYRAWERDAINDMNGEVSQVRIEAATNVGGKEGQAAMENLYTKMRVLFQEHLEAA